VIALKPGVDATILTPQIVLAITVVNSLWNGATITSLNDGTHQGKPVTGTDKDPHYLGLAVDLRLPTEDIDGAINRLRAALGNQYVVLLESNHVHVQFGHIAQFGHVA
jgi:hypothetical protein